MRKYKNVKRKEIVFELEEWVLIEAWAEKFQVTTTEYIKQATLTDKITVSKTPESWGVLIEDSRNPPSYGISSTHPYPASCRESTYSSCRSPRSF